MVPIFIGHGAPLGIHLRTLGIGVSLGQDGLYEHIPVSFDADLVVIDLDIVDQRFQIGFAGGVSCQHL